MMKYLFIYIIKFYQFFLSPFLGSNCRFYPTCSNYALEAFKKYNTFSALKFIILRVLRCNPWGGSGIDLLPKSDVKNKN